MITVQQARYIIDRQTPTLGTEMVPLLSAGGRVASKNIYAPLPSPRFNNSAMDGFAVRHVDTMGATEKSPVILKIVGTAAAGTPSKRKINRGECMKCMTGAPIPDGADAIVMVEDTSGFTENRVVKIFQEAPLGQHIRRMGEEIKPGELLVHAGTRLSPSEIGVLASFGYGKIPVRKKPRVSIFVTGTELIKPGRKLKASQIYNSNLFVFLELSKISGALIVDNDVLKDNRDDLKKALTRALKKSDIIVSSGGVSMGTFDYVREIYLRLGIKEHYWQIAQKPGRPFFFGTYKKKLVFGIPGNPVSAFIGWLAWIRPTLSFMMQERMPPPIFATLTQSFPREKARYRYLFGKVWSENGELKCFPTTKLSSHMLTSSLETNAILKSEMGETVLQPGDKIEVEILPWRSIL